MQQRATVPGVKSMQEAGAALLSRAVDPSPWMLPGRRVTVDNRVRVDTVEVCASVDLTPTLETFLRVSFKGPRLSPMLAAELLVQFVAWFVDKDDTHIAAAIALALLTGVAIILDITVRRGAKAAGVLKH